MMDAAWTAARDVLDDAGYTEDRLWDMEVTRAAVDLDNALGATTSSALPRRLFRTSGADLLDMEFPVTPWLIRGLMKDHGLHGVAAEPKNIKTWVMMEKAFAVASGMPAFGEFEVCGEPGHVAVFAAEDHLRACKAKLRAIGASKGVAIDKLRGIAANFHFESLTRIDVRKKDHLAEIVASARTLPSSPRLMIFDPLIKVHSAKENDSTEMEVVTGNLQAIGRVVGCAIEFVHHNGKASESSGKRRGGQRMRGSGSLHGAVDGGLYLDPPSGNRTTEWTVRIESEIKGALSAPPFTVELRVLEDDEHGEAKLISWDVKKGDRPQGLEDRIIDALRAEFQTGLSAANMQKRLGCQKEALLEALKALLGRRLITHEGGGHSSRYYLNAEGDTSPDD